MLKGVIAAAAALACIAVPSLSFADALDLARQGKAWHSQESTSPLDDAKQFVGVLIDPKSQTVLSVGCLERQIVVLIVLRDKYVGGRKAEIIYRVDKLPASEPQEWRVIDGTTVSADSSARSFISNFKDGSNLFVRVIGKQSGSVDANFSLGNVSQVLAKVQGYCPRG